MSDRTKWFWCLSCQHASKHLVAECLECGSSDPLVIHEITEEWADQRLAALKVWRRVKDETIPGHRQPKCQTCGGVKLGKGSQKFLSSGARKEASDDRWTGPARIIFSAGNVTGGSTEEVKVCRCIQLRGPDPKRKRTYTRFVEAEEYVPGERPGEKARVAPVYVPPEKEPEKKVVIGAWLAEKHLDELLWKLRPLHKKLWAVGFRP